DRAAEDAAGEAGVEERPRSPGPAAGREDGIRSRPGRRDLHAGRAEPVAARRRGVERAFCCALMFRAFAGNVKRALCQEGTMSGPSGQKRTYGAAGRGDLLMFEPEVLQVITDPKHPQYDPRVELPVDEALVLSIMELGVITPLAISRDGEDVYVTDRRRRHKAAIEANKRLKKLGRPLVQGPCVWKRGDDTRLFEISIAANELRKGDGAVERAKKMQRLVEAGRSEEQIALTFGVTAKTGKSALALLECAKPVQL